MLERLLGSKAGVRVLGTVLSADGLHLREVARRAGVAPSEAKHALDTLVDAGVLGRERKGRQVFFTLNARCPFLGELRALYAKTEGFAASLREAAAGIAGVRYAFVFGSTAGGGGREHSDIDLMLIGGIDEDEAMGRILEAQKGTGREINYIVWSERELLEKAAAGGAFLKGVLNNKRVWLVGDEDEFVRAAKKGSN